MTGIQLNQPGGWLHVEELYLAIRAAMRTDDPKKDYGLPRLAALCSILVSMIDKAPKEFGPKPESMELLRDAAMLVSMELFQEFPPSADELAKITKLQNSYDA